MSYSKKKGIEPATGAQIRSGFRVLQGGWIAHDLNNILSGLVSYPELLLMDLPVDSPLRDSVLTIQSSDLLILDMIMEPGMDGLDAYKKILEMHPRQKAIIASGFSETQRVREAQRLGASMFASLIP